MSGENHYVYGDKFLLQLTEIKNVWDRSTVILIGDYNSNPFNLTIGVFYVGDKIISNLYGQNNSILKFYTDNINLFLQFNGGNNQLGNVTAYSFNSDSGYRKAKIVNIPIEQLVEFTF